MSLVIRVEGDDLWWRLFPLCRAEVLRALARMAAMGVACGGGPVSPDMLLDLMLVRDAEIAELNAQHMDCPGPTNILSFPLESVAGETLCGSTACAAPEECPAGPRDAGFSLGCLALSVDSVAREALLYGQERGEHCLRLLAHGLGHLFGHDHGEEMDSFCEAMLDAALRVEGVASPFTVKGHCV